MKQLAARFLLLLMISFSVLPVQAATISKPVPAAESTPASTPDKETVQSALKEFKSLSRKERKARIKEAKKVWKEYRAQKKANRDDGEVMLVLLVILAILLPPLAVFLKEGVINVKFWISLILSLLVFLLWPLWLIAVAYALLVVFEVV